MSYNHKKIEPKWQEYWTNNNTFLTSEDNKPKYYVLDMFPYPSGSGLHVGHALGYVATDIIARFKRMKGFNVLHPMGWDAFGLPAEQYAIKTGTHPSVTTSQNIQNFKRQINQLGFSYDWSKEINTTEPEYYKWTQWLFITLHEKGIHKPSPEPFKQAMKDLDVLPNETIMVGDWPERDIKGANEVGMKTAFAKYGDTFDTKNSGADFELEDISDLINIIYDINN